MSEKFEINTIKIKSFRGIVDYELDMSKKSLVLCGENGSGKSSIVNAFEYLFTGKVDSLSGSREINHSKSLINITGDKNDVYVEALIGEDNISRSFKDGFNYSDNLQDLVDDFSNGSFVLNRQKLVSFINSTPNQRYKNINKIIGFDKLDEIETTLKKTNRMFKNAYKSKTDELTYIIGEIEKTYDCDIENVYDEINKILQEHNLELISPNTDLKDFIKDFSKSDYERKTQLKELNNLCDINITDLDLKLQKLLDDYEEISLYQLKYSSKLLNI